MVGTLRRGFQALLVVDMVLATQECRFAKHSPILHVYFVCFRHISMRQQDRDRERGGVREDVRLPCRTGCRAWGQPGFGPLTGVSRQVVQLSLEWEGSGVAWAPRRPRLQPTKAGASDAAERMDGRWARVPNRKTGGQRVILGQCSPHRVGPGEAAGGAGERTRSQQCLGSEPAWAWGLPRPSSFHVPHNRPGSGETRCRGKESDFIRQARRPRRW